MQVVKTVPYFLLITLMATLPMAGCSGLLTQTGDRSLPNSQGQETEAVNRFQESAPHGRTAIESAIELSKEHAKLSQEMIQLQQENRDMTGENQQLKEQVTSLDSSLKQAQKELNESNDLLIEMRIELNNWKTDVLGFREEMQDAEKAQLEALVKILRLLGAEVRTETAQDENEDSASASATDGP